MKNTNPKNARHKQWMLRMLIEIADDSTLAGKMAFKGGSCAAMLGYLDRFSVDLDFDLLDGASMDIKDVRIKLHKIFLDLGLDVDDESKSQLQFFLKYKSRPNERNTLKLEIIDTRVKSNVYQKSFFQEVDRYIQCQTLDTMFANKMVALLDRFEKHGNIAGRDVYDINHFFVQGLKYNAGVIEERRGMSVIEYLVELREFIDTRITQRVITEDLNFLLSPDQFNMARKYLKQEVLNNINGEIQRLG